MKVLRRYDGDGERIWREEREDLGISRETFGPYSQKLLIKTMYSGHQPSLKYSNGLE